MREVFILECQECNGEYGVTVHKSVHSTKELALDLFNRILDPELLKCEGSINSWDMDATDRNVEQFRTGMWGFIVWTITSVPLYGEYAEPRHQQYEDKNKDFASILKLTMLPLGLTDTFILDELINYYHRPKMFLTRTITEGYPCIYYKVNYGPTEWAQGEDCNVQKFEEWLAIYLNLIDLPVGTSCKKMSTGQLRELFMKARHIDHMHFIDDKLGYRIQAITVADLEKKNWLPPKDRDPNNPWDDGLDDEADDEEVVPDGKIEEPESEKCPGGCGRHPNVCMCHDNDEAYK